jgi:hypothetical protein
VRRTRSEDAVLLTWMEGSNTRAWLTGPPGAAVEVSGKVRVQSSPHRAGGWACGAHMAIQDPYSGLSCAHWINSSELPTEIKTLMERRIIGYFATFAMSLLPERCVFVSFDFKRLALIK